MLVKYYLSDNIKASFEDFALGLQNAWVGPGCDSWHILWYMGPGLSRAQNVVASAIVISQVTKCNSILFAWSLLQEIEDYWLMFYSSSGVYMAQEHVRQPCASLLVMRCTPTTISKTSFEVNLSTRKISFYFFIFF